LDHHTRTLEDVLAKLGPIPPDAWRRLAERHPFTAKRLAVAAHKLADLLDGVPGHGTITG
jgi:hypothetical protein